MKATPDQLPASLASDLGRRGAPVSTCLNFELVDRKDIARLQRAALVRCVSEMATTPASMLDKMWCLPCNPDGLQIPSFQGASGPGTRASPTRHIVKIKRMDKIALKGRDSPGVNLALGKKPEPPCLHSVRGFFARMASMRLIWSVSIVDMCWVCMSSCIFICCCRVCTWAVLCWWCSWMVHSMAACLEVSC